MNTIILFRVDALPNMGLGHLIRCIALADCLKLHFDCTFLIREDGLQAAPLIEKAGYSFKAVPLCSNKEEEAKWICNNILTGNEIVLLDGYQFDATYQRILKSSVGKLVCIDDIHDTFFVADAVINSAGSVRKEDYDCADHTQLFLGLDYLTLRESFHNRKTDLANKHFGLDVMICLGGEDPNNETLKVLQKCESVSGINSCGVIVGINYQHKDKLNSFRKNSELSIEVFQNQSASEMVNIMQSCHTAICSPSTTSLEYLSVGGNLFLHQIADNQKHVLSYLLEKGLGFKLEELGQISSERKSNALALQKDVIDGKSPLRLTRIFLNLENELHCSFRKATKKDVDLYFLWANDPMTRQQSFTSAPIPYEEHCNWFENKLVDEACMLYVFQFKNTAVGQIRFTLLENRATISYSLNLNFRGRGLGNLLIKKGIEQLKIDLPEIKLIEGYVKSENKPSIRAFQKLGFSQENESRSKYKFLQLI